MRGDQYVAQFLKAINSDKVFLVQGGACAFMLDAVGETPGMEYVAFQHEQAAAMAADALWRTSGQLGVTFCTSGPGASNLLTGIACGYYDSIPSLHICGQVNGKEVAQYKGAKVRQAGFQQMDIVSMAAPVCNYAVAVTKASELPQALKTAVEMAFTGRMGPVLVDIPMDVQTEDIGTDEILLPEFPKPRIDDNQAQDIASKINEFFKGSMRPLVVLGAGVELGGQQDKVVEWLNKTHTPFVASWSALNIFDHDMTNYLGHFGVYGNRGGNYVIQNADRILVLGSRLDNRQTSGNVDNFAPRARLMALDIDGEELVKYPDRFTGIQVNLAHLDKILKTVETPESSSDWLEYCSRIRERFLARDISQESSKYNSLNPYSVVRIITNLLDDDAHIFADAGANHVWLYQMWHRKGKQKIFTSSGHYAMGYSLPAAIGSLLGKPDGQAVSFNGDGGFQMNLQELQTAREYGLDLKVVVFNNQGLGMIRQFQNSYMGGRHHATTQGQGPGVPDFAKLAAAYGMKYTRITEEHQIDESLFAAGARLIECVIDQRVLIEPKLEMGRPINDQFPYVTDEEFLENNQFVEYAHRSR
jgi:acetolactate synthase-1/2/3 large subunit